MPRFRRSRGGCATCKRRKRKCDETRPACMACRAKGIECDGYDIRLRWGSDSIASASHHGSRVSSKPGGGSEPTVIGTPESNAGESNVGESNAGETTAGESIRSPPAAPSETSPVSLPSYQFDESSVALSSPEAINEETQLAFQRCQFQPRPELDKASADVTQFLTRAFITSTRRRYMSGSNHSSQRRQNLRLLCSSSAQIYRSFLKMATH